jgi:hypothetical protein
VIRHFDNLDAVLEFDALDNLRLLVLSLQSSPCLCGGIHELEHHELGDLRRQGTLVRTVRCRTVTNPLSIGFDVRRWSQCSAGKSKKASKASRSLVRQETALSCISRNSI